LKKKGGDSHDKDGDGWRVSKQKNQMENKLSRFFGFSPFFFFYFIIIFLRGVYLLRQSRAHRACLRTRNARSKEKRSEFRPAPPCRSDRFTSFLILWHEGGEERWRGT
jgi:hypothetical protein